MTGERETFLKVWAGGVVLAILFYVLVLAVHVIEQIYPCRATDPSTGASRAVSCINQEQQRENP